MLVLTRRLGESLVFNRLTNVRLLYFGARSAVFFVSAQNALDGERVRVPIGKFTEVLPGVDINATPNDRGSGLRIRIEAPKSVNIARAELLERASA